MNNIDFRYAPASSWTPICRPDDRHKSLVREDGALLYGFRQTHLGAFSFDRTVEPRAQTTHAPLAVTQRTTSARVPVVETIIEYPHCRLELRAGGHRTLDGHRYDVVLWSLRVNPEVDSTLTGLHIDITERGDVRHAAAGTAPDQRVFALAPHQVGEYPLFLDDTDSTVPATPDAELVMTSDPQRLAVTHATGFRAASGLRTIPEVVTGGQTLHGALIVPLDGGPVDGLDLEWARQALRTERHYWESLPALDLPIRVPDTDMQDMLVAAARNMLQARDVDATGRAVFQVGPTVYRGLWVVDGYFLLEAARYLGLDDDASHGIGALLDKVRPDGSINALSDVLDATAHPHTKETGIAIATLVRQWQLSGDDAWLTEVWPVIRDGVRHIATLRAAAAELPVDSPAHGLMPPAFADGGAAGVRPELTTALWTVAGLGYASRAARALGAEEAAEIAHQRDSLVDDIHRVARRDRQDLYPDSDHNGHGYLPMVLPGSGDHHTIADVNQAHATRRLRPQTATWALAQTIWPGEVFASDDEVVRDFLALLDSIDDAEEAPVETGWLPHSALWTYYASFAAHVWLYSGDRDKAVEMLYGMCQHAAPTRVWREEQALAGTGIEQLWGDMPHNWASAELIRLVRHLAVFETGEELRLLWGVPASWSQAGGLAISRTPTRFGRVSLEMTDETIDITMDSCGADRVVLAVPPGRWQVVSHIDGVTYRDAHHGPRVVTLVHK